jgi:hypothetical protein
MTASARLAIGTIIVARPANTTAIPNDQRREREAFLARRDGDRVIGHAEHEQPDGGPDGQDDAPDAADARCCPQDLAIDLR